MYHNFGWILFLLAILVDVALIIGLARGGYTWLLGWHGIKIGQALAPKGNNTRLALLAIATFVAVGNFLVFAGIGKPFLGISGWEDVTPNAAWQFELKNPRPEAKEARSEYLGVLAEELGNNRVRRYEPTPAEDAKIQADEEARAKAKAAYIAKQNSKYSSWIHFWLAVSTLGLLIIYIPIACREEFFGALQDAYEVVRSRRQGSDTAAPVAGTTATTTAKTWAGVIGLDLLIGFAMYFIERMIGKKIAGGSATGTP